MSETIQLQLAPLTIMGEKAFTKPTGEVLRSFAVTEERGLSSAEVEKRREQYGRNGG